MKILYAATLDPFGTAYSRLVSIRQLNNDVQVFDADPFYKQLGKVNKLFRDFAFPRIASRHSASLLERCEETRPDIVWLDTCEWITRSALSKLRSLGIFSVRHTTDALFPEKPWLLKLRRHWFRYTIGDFDMVLTSNEKDVETLRKKHGEKIKLTDLGYDHRRFNNDPISDDLRSKWDGEIVFVGHYEPRTEAAILALIDAGINVNVYGHSPWFRSQNRNKLGKHLREKLSNKDYEYVLKSAKIGLCCVSEWNYNQTAARSFEIPASGTFLLAMRTSRHQEFFEEGREAEFFGNHAELIEKTRYYLENPDKRLEIASAGHRRCIESGYCWDAIMKRDYEKLVEAYSNWKANS